MFPFVVPVIVAALLSPALVYMYTKGFLPGSLTRGSVISGLGKVEEARWYKNALVLRLGQERYVGICYIDIGDPMYSEGYTTADGLYLRAKLLGRALANVDSRVELRFHKVPLSTEAIEKRLEGELNAVRAVVESQGPSPELKERERRLVNMLERIKKGEKASWFSAYLVLYAEGRSLEEAGEKAINETENLMKALKLVLGGRVRMCTRRQVRKSLESLLAGPPTVRTVIRLDRDPLPPPLPPVERGSLSPRGVFLGYRADSQVPFLYDVRRFAVRHMLVVGPTGKGKTTLLATLVNRSYARGLVDFLVVDPKGDLDRVLVRSVPRLYIGRKTVGGFEENAQKEQSVEELERALGTRLVLVNPKDAIESIENVLRAEGSRYLSLVNLTDEGRFLVIRALLKALLEWMYELEPIGRLRMIVAVDEAWRSSEASIYYVKRIVKESRSFGIGLTLLTQTVGDLPEELLSNFGTLVVFGSQEENYLKAAASLLGINAEEAKELLSGLGVGEAVFKLPESQSPVVVEIDPEV